MRQTTLSHSAQRVLSQWEQLGIFLVGHKQQEKFVARPKSDVLELVTSNVMCRAIERGEFMSVFGACVFLDQNFSPFLKEVLLSPEMAPLLERNIFSISTAIAYIKTKLIFQDWKKILNDISSGEFSIETVGPGETIAVRYSQKLIDLFDVLRMLYNTPAEERTDEIKDRMIQTNAAIADEFFYFGFWKLAHKHYHCVFSLNENKASIEIIIKIIFVLDRLSEDKTTAIQLCQAAFNEHPENETIKTELARLKSSDYSKHVVDVFKERRLTLEPFISKEKISRLPLSDRHQLLWFYDAAIHFVFKKNFLSLPELFALHVNEKFLMTYHAKCLFSILEHHVFNFVDIMQLSATDHENEMESSRGKLLDSFDSFANLVEKGVSTYSEITALVSSLTVNDRIQFFYDHGNAFFDLSLACEKAILVKERGVTFEILIQMALAGEHREFMNDILETPENTARAVRTPTPGIELFQVATNGRQPPLSSEKHDVIVAWLHQH